MHEMTVAATPKFFKRKMPVEATMDLRVQASAVGDSVLFFLRDLADETPYPSRIRINLTEHQARSLARGLIECADQAKRRLSK